MKKVNAYINRYFGLILFAFALVGLFIPFPEVDLAAAITVSLATIIFASYFRIELNRDLIIKETKPVLSFLLIRFIILPVFAFLAIRFFSDFYAIIVLLLLLMPAAVSSPSFTAMYEGNLGMALKMLVFSSFLSIVTIPFITAFLLKETIVLDTAKLFMTLVYTIIIPFVLHLPLRKIKKVSNVFIQNSPFITAAGLAVIFVIAMSKNRGVILENPMKMFTYGFISIGIYIALYFTGFYLPVKQNFHNRIACSVSSGANNIGLGVTITTLYFTGEINIFLIVSQFAWILALIPMRLFYKKFQHF